MNNKKEKRKIPDSIPEEEEMKPEKKDEKEITKEILVKILEDSASQPTIEKQLETISDPEMKIRVEYRLKGIKDFLDVYFMESIKE